MQKPHAVDTNIYVVPSMFGLMHGFLMLAAG